MNITATWVPDPNLPSDPAPPTVETIETAGAGRSGTNGDGTAATGSVSNGLDPASTTVTSVVTPSTDASGKTLVPPVHLMKWSGGSFSFTRTFSVSASASNGSAGGTCSAGVALNVYRIQIHAQPYGWHDEGHFDANGNQSSGPLIDNTAGTMTFLYTFRSTSGNIADLKGIKVYEYIDYSGNPGTFGTDNTGPYYRPTSPPIGKTATGGTFELDQPHYGYIDPTVSYPRDSTGHTMSYTGDGHLPFPTMKSYSILTITAPQKYEFDDPATNDKGTVLYDPGNIVDAVKLNPNVFYISKSGYSVTSALPQ